MTARAARIDQILAYPDDDLLRLSHAVDLDADNDPQGAFIKLQVERWNQERSSKHHRDRPSGAETKLISAHGAAWAGELAGLVRGYSFHRGFVAMIQLSPAQFARNADRIFALAPIQHADIDNGDPASVDAALASPHLAKLRSVSFAKNGIDDALCGRIATCTHLRNARWVRLTDNQIGPDGVDALAASSIFDNKVIVDLMNNPCNPVERPMRDWDGSVQGVEMPAEGHAIVARHGKKSWLTFPWFSMSKVPDRYHA